MLEEGAEVRGSVIQGPVTIGKGTVIKDAVIGHYTSIGRNCVVTNSKVDNCVLFDGARVDGLRQLQDSILGHNAVVRRLSEYHCAPRLMIGDDAQVFL